MAADILLTLGLDDARRRRLTAERQRAERKALGQLRRHRQAELEIGRLARGEEPRFPDGPPSDSGCREEHSDPEGDEELSIGGETRSYSPSEGATASEGEAAP